MPAPITSAFRRLVETVRGFSVAQRTIAIIGIAVLVLGVSAFATWALKPQYSPLFSGVNGSDANAIVEQLRSDNVPYQLADGGATILVPQEHVYDERLKAAAAGLPSSNTGGYSLLDKMGVTSSEFQQSVTYKRAIEGELAHTIGALKGVKGASVHLAIPKDTVFVAQKADPTASVFVETQAGVTLTTDQVQAIVHLTSASVEGMKPEDVAVIDAKGTVLSAVGVGATGGADQQASDYESRVQASVQSMLDRVVGPGNASVIVAADMSYESAQRTEETFSTPEDTPPLSETSTTETYQGSGGGAAGVLGPDNIAVPGGAGGNGNYSSEQSTKNNAVNKVTETRTIPAGAITRQTVSVAVDAKAAENVNASSLSDLVASAAGIDRDRGDEVTVKIVDFNNAGAGDARKALDAAEADAAAERVNDLVRTGIITLGIAVPLVLALILYARYSKRRRREVLADWEAGKEQDALEAAAAPGLLEASAALPPLLDPGAEPGEVDRKRADIANLAGSDPAATANLLRGLLDEKAGV